MDEPPFPSPSRLPGPEIFGAWAVKPLAYDVPSGRRRTRLAHTLKDFGERVQYSVFECRLEAEDLDRLRARVRKLLKTEEDQLRIYRRCANCSRQVELFGAGKVVEDTDVIVI